MKFSYNWLCELVEGVDVSPNELGRLITMKTAECEGVEAYGAHLAQVCAARVTDAVPMPGGRNKKVTVDTGRYGIKTVVCGAPNCREEITSAYVPAGTRLGDTEIRNIEIAGVASDGMLASGAELGINRDAAGILELDGAPGDPIPGCAPDYIIEIDNKSLTHRPDLWGHYGLAREVAAILRKPLNNPVNVELLPSGDPDIRIRIDDYDLCPRYSALTFENITVQPSPLWMQYRLESIGLNSISNMVDVTNYIMSEISEPMHAFDRDTLNGDTIIVRPASDGEFLTALNGETYRLDTSNLVIADTKGPVAIGGVIGGLDTGVVAHTKRIVLEAANFHAGSIRKTSSKLKLRTDASARFEKAQDPTNTVRGLARAVELLRQVSPGVRIIGGLVDTKREISAPPQIALHMDWLERKLGRAVEMSEVEEILAGLEFGVQKVSSKTIAVTVPSWRATRDISIKDDLVEEVGRMVGYDSITPTAPLIPSEVPPANPERLFHRQVSAAAAAQGFTEVHNYSFISEEMAREFGMYPEAHLAVLNPIASDQNLMRMSLVPGVVKNIRLNAKHLDAFALFEIGYEIHPPAKQQPGAHTNAEPAAPAPAEGHPDSEKPGPAKLPDEIDHLVAAVYAREGDGTAGLFEVKRLTECLMPGAELSPTAARPIEHPARAYEVSWQDTPLGRIFELHPRMVEGRAALLDIDLRQMRRLGPLEKKYHPLRRFPASAFDLSVITGVRELSGVIRNKLTTLAGSNLESIVFLRQYSGKPLPDDKQSLSYRLTVFAADHTLTTDEVSAIRDRIIDGMREAGYELRV